LEPDVLSLPELMLLWQCLPEEPGDIKKKAMKPQFLEPNFSKDSGLIFQMSPEKSLLKSITFIIKPPIKKKLLKSVKEKPFLTPCNFPSWLMSQDKRLEFTSIRKI
jgi:hypothetical protein